MTTEYKLSYTASEIDKKLGVVDNALLYTEQILTEEQKAQVRENIGLGNMNSVFFSDDGNGDITIGTKSADMKIVFSDDGNGNVKTEVM